MSRRTRMLRRVAATAALLTAAAGLAPASAEGFRKLGEPQIRRTLSGMEFTDRVHWAYVFAKSGKLTSVAMGQRGSGTWRVAADRLCLVRPGEQERCYEVWRSGNSISMREPGFDLSEDGILQKRIQRN